MCRAAVFNCVAWRATLTSQGALACQGLHKRPMKLEFRVRLSTPTVKRVGQKYGAGCLMLNTGEFISDIP